MSEYPGLILPQKICTYLRICENNYKFKYDYRRSSKLVDNWIKEKGVRYFNELTNTTILMEEVGNSQEL